MKSGVTLESLYLDMINSSRYQSLNVLREEFFQKMNFTGNNIWDLRTDDDYLDWIRININNTYFDNYEDAVTKWNIIKTENALVIHENIDFYHMLAEEPENSTVFFNILIDNAPEVEPFSSCTCIGDYNDNVIALTSGYTSAMASLNSQAGEMSPDDYGAECNTLNMALCESLGAALDQYNNCTEECEE